MNGAFASFDMRLAISVLPTPVGPIIIMLFGIISSFMFSDARLKKKIHRLPQEALPGVPYATARRWWIAPDLPSRAEFAPVD